MMTDKKLTKKQEFEAEIRNKLTLPLTVLNQFVEGKKIPQDQIKLAIKSLYDVLKVLNK